MIELIKRVERAFNERDIRAIEVVLSEHLIDRSRFLGGVDVRIRLNRLLTAFPDARLTVHDWLIQGETVAARWTIEGTHQGDLLAVPASGKRATLSGLAVAYVRNGRVVEYWEFPDLPAFIEQFGRPPLEEPRRSEAGSAP